MEKPKTAVTAADTLPRIVEVKTRDVYGQSLIYPVNFEAYAFSALTGKKTFHPSDLRRIETLGFTIRWA